MNYDRGHAAEAGPLRTSDAEHDDAPVRRRAVSLDYLRAIAGAIVGRSSTDPRARRLAGMLQGVATGIGNKLLAVLVSFVSVPLTIGYLGTERFGAWVVIGSALAWLGLTDFGLGHGLTNAVTTAASQERPDLVRMHLSNFLFVMVLVVLGMTPVLFGIGTRIDLANLFGVHTPLAVRELNQAVAIALVFFLLRMPLSFSGRIYNAYQEGRIANYWAAAGNVANLLCLIAVTRTSGGLPMLVLATSGAGLVIELANSIWLFTRHRPTLRPGYRYIDRTQIHAISHVGIQFFVITAMALVTFQTDTLIVAHFLGAKAVPSYSVPYALFNYATLPQAMLFPYLWAAYNEAIARGDIGWVRRTFGLSVTVGVGSTAVVACVMFLLSRPFILWWAGPPAVPTFSLAATMAVWVVINAFTNPIACLLAAASHLRLQIIYTALATVANLALSVYLVGRLGATGVIGATVLAYLVFVCVPIYVDARRLLTRLEARQRVS